ncbi:hypothetical protein [Burkholderia pseudomultivorans]|uniref:hypothetical protein n=1 Tax=Burkholderia pseudomultivorans TaxID=1207504 RepID=UPI001E48FB80|nr:hypothetical protein [Burkholderia pseudomultivorans]
MKKTNVPLKTIVTLVILGIALAWALVVSMALPLSGSVFRAALIYGFIGVVAGYMMGIATRESMGFPAEKTGKTQKYQD